MGSLNLFSQFLLQFIHSKNILIECLFSAGLCSRPQEREHGQDQQSLLSRGLQSVKFKFSKKKKKRLQYAIFKLDLGENSLLPVQHFGTGSFQLL